MPLAAWDQENWESAMLTIRQEKTSDAAAREALLEAAYGPIRFEKPSHRLRAGRAPARGLSFVAVEDGHIVGTVRLWDVSAGASSVLLLGPLAVEPAQRRRGIGAELMRHAVRAASRRGHRAMLLAGDASYYSRFGFSAEKTGRLWLPGLADKSRLLGCELVAGALDGVRGSIRTPQKPARAPLVAALKPQAA
jgi:predicted N-acetyltransferase YhbS